MLRAPNATKREGRERERGGGGSEGGGKGIAEGEGPAKAGSVIGESRGPEGVGEHVLRIYRDSYFGDLTCGVIFWERKIMFSFQMSRRN